MAVSRLKDIPGIGVDRMGDLADAAADPDLLRLENLDTDIRPPAAALEATRRAIEDDAANSYLPFLGQWPLRRAAVGHVSRMSGVDHGGPENCVITAGGLSGILTSLLALLEPGDRVLLPAPIYAGLINRVRLAGGEPVFVPTRPTPEGWRLDRDALRGLRGQGIRVVLAMSPAMPTGCWLDAEDWAALAELCRAEDAWLLYDAAMERLLYDGRAYLHPAALPGLGERTITVDSVSKHYRMIGWRVGWVVGPPRIMPDIGLASIHNVVCQVGIAMAAAEAALSAADDGVADAVVTWQARRDLILRELDGLPAIPPAGGWSLLLDCAPLGLTGAEASRRLFAEAKIAATPMDGWGPGAERYLRFVFANEPVERLAGLGERVRRALA